MSSSTRPSAKQSQRDLRARSAENAGARRPSCNATRQRLERQRPANDAHGSVDAVHPAWGPLGPPRVRCSSDAAANLGHARVGSRSAVLSPTRRSRTRRRNAGAVAPRCIRMNRLLCARAGHHRAVGGRRSSGRLGRTRSSGWYCVHSFQSQVERRAQPLGARIKCGRGRVVRAGTASSLRASGARLVAGEWQWQPDGTVLARRSSRNLDGGPVALTVGRLPNLPPRAATSATGNPFPRFLPQLRELGVKSQLCPIRSYGRECRSGECQTVRPTGLACSLID